MSIITSFIFWDIMIALGLVVRYKTTKSLIIKTLSVSGLGFVIIVLAIIGISSAF